MQENGGRGTFLTWGKGTGLQRALGLRCLLYHHQVGRPLTLPAMCPTPCLWRKDVLKTMGWDRGQGVALGVGQALTVTEDLAGSLCLLQRVTLLSHCNPRLDDPRKVNCLPLHAKYA